jgi:hypothetical protein
MLGTKVKMGQQCLTTECMLGVAKDRVGMGLGRCRERVQDTSEASGLSRLQE